MARQVMEQIVQSGRVQRGRIGVSIQDLPPAGRKVSGPRRPDRQVVGGSPAEKAGLRKGDVVVKADGAVIRSAAQLRNKVGLTPVGKAVRLTVEQDGAAHEISVVVAAPDAVAAGNRK